MDEGDRPVSEDDTGDLSGPDADAAGRTDTPAGSRKTGPRETEPRSDIDAADESRWYRFRHDKDGALMWIREMLSSVAIVLVLGLLLFGVSGVWPPMVAVESGSMEPNMEVGDLVFVTDPGRFAPDAATNDIGVVTHEEGTAADYQTFGSYGSVVIYQPPGRTASPIIHRSMFRVEEGENWYDRADDRYHNADDCGELQHCPAPHGGFITLGDNNGAYDQANGLAAPVREDWVTGVARIRVPYLGYVRLIATGQAEIGDVVGMSVEVGTIEMTGESIVPIRMGGTVSLVDRPDGVRSAEAA
jgi:signal peptidase